MRQQQDKQGKHGGDCDKEREWKASTRPDLTWYFIPKKNYSITNNDHDNGTQHTDTHTRHTVTIQETPIEIKQREKWEHNGMRVVCVCEYCVYLYPMKAILYVPFQERCIPICLYNSHHPVCSSTFLIQLVGVLCVCVRVGVSQCKKIAAC